MRTPQALRTAAAELIKAAEMLEHNDAIFKGKWKKGSKAWSGDFIERIVRDAFSHIGCHTEAAELACRIGDQSARLAAMTIERDSLRTAFENEKATSVHLEELVEAERAEKNALMSDLRKCENQLYRREGTFQATSFNESGLRKLPEPVYYIDSKPHRLCDCNPHGFDCPRGETRRLLTAEMSRCLVPLSEAEKALIVSLEG